ncbi:MAG: hypothetical protein HOE90_08745 [Bacteriovoracaceae bacterium]|mgnify:CR=1 FL=1|jgi:hypothetical protein|nr:hypothetical protein [Bacteriovoracaceae bacterium]
MNTLARKTQEVGGTHLPAQWKDQVTQVLELTYETGLASKNSCFDVFGVSFDNEILVVLSVINKEKVEILPTTLFLSADMEDSEKNLQKTLAALTDASGVFFDAFFEQEHYDDYITNWAPEKFKELDFFYKISRENISLTLIANELLKEEK